MERRKDHRHGLRYTVSLKCIETGRHLGHVATRDVSASGLRLLADEPHGLHIGERVEVQLFARVQSRQGDDLLVMGTDGIVVRARRREAAVRFDRPLTY